MSHTIAELETFVEIARDERLDKYSADALDAALDELAALREAAAGMLWFPVAEGSPDPPKSDWYDVTLRAKAKGESPSFTVSEAFFDPQDEDGENWWVSRPDGGLSPVSIFDVNTADFTQLVAWSHKRPAYVPGNSTRPASQGKEQQDTN